MPHDAGFAFAAALLLTGGGGHESCVVLCVRINKASGPRSRWLYMTVEVDVDTVEGSAVMVSVVLNEVV